MTAEPVQIDIVSDVMCPWCLIGKRRFEKALAMRPDVQVDIRWRPFQLDSTLPDEGMDRQEYLSRKFGGPERADQIYQAVRDAGKQEGIPFAFEKIEYSSNTLNAHRVIRWAATADCQDAVVERLFKMYFIEGRNIGDKEVLREAAVDAGMDEELVTRLLATDADRDLVEKEIELARQIGVTGVPCFIVANKYVVMGAEQPETIAGAIDMALKGETEEAVSQSTPQ